MVNKELARKCFAYRVAHSISQKEMARRCKLDAQTILKCENGRSINRMSEAKIMTVVGKIE